MFKLVKIIRENKFCDARTVNVIIHLDTKLHDSKKLPYLQEIIIRSYPECIQFNTHPDKFNFNTSALPYTFPNKIWYTLLTSLSIFISRSFSI
jgi:hypothetical protein